MESSEALSDAKRRLGALTGDGAKFLEIWIRSTRSSEGRQLLTVSARMDGVGPASRYILEYDQLTGRLVNLWKNGARLDPTRGSDGNGANGDGADGFGGSS